VFKVEQRERRYDRNTQSSAHYARHTAELLEFKNRAQLTRVDRRLDVLPHAAGGHYQFDRAQSFALAC